MREPASYEIVGSGVRWSGVGVGVGAMVGEVVAVGALVSIGEAVGVGDGAVTLGGEPHDARIKPSAPTNASMRWSTIERRRIHSAYGRCLR